MAESNTSLPCVFCDSPDGSKWHRASCVEISSASDFAPRPEIICLDGDVFESVEDMRDHIELVHVGIDIPELPEAAAAGTLELEELAEAIPGIFVDLASKDARLALAARILARLSSARADKAGST